MNIQSVPQKRRRQTRSQLAWIGFGLLSFFVYLRFLITEISDYDLWMHLATGRAMAQSCRIIDHDIFTHTISGTFWLNFEWLGQLFLYGLVNCFGIGGILFFKILACILVLGLLLLSARLVGVGGRWLLLLGWIGFLLYATRLNERLELFSFLFIELTICLLLWAARQKNSNRLPWIFFPFFVIWSNLHGGFVFGLAVIFLFDIGARWSKRPIVFVRTLDRCFVSAMAGTIINPYGVKLIPFLGWMYRETQKSPIIMEWQPSSVATQPFFWTIYLLCFAIIVFGLWKRSPVIRFWTPAVLFFAVWGGLSVRNSCYFGFIVVPFLADCIHSYPEIFKRVSNILPLLAVVPLFIYGHLLAAPLPKSYIRPSFFPDAACQFVIENNIQGPLFNSYGFGGYLEWRLGPNRPVFMDGRYPFMKFMEEQRSFFKGAVEDTVDRWREYFQRYKINFAITNYPAYIPEGPFAELSPLNMMFPRSDWALVYWDDAALVFLFRNKINAALIAKFEYKLSRPYNLLQLERLLQAQVISPKDLEGEIDRHVKETGPSQRGERMRYLLRSLSSGQPAG